MSGKRELLVDFTLDASDTITVDTIRNGATIGDCFHIYDGTGRCGEADVVAISEPTSGPDREWRIVLHLDVLALHGRPNPPHIK